MHVAPPLRKSYTYVQQLTGSPDDIFALLCPVRECDWIAGWNPRLVISACGVAETGCIFITADGQAPSGELREATWVVTERDPKARYVAMTKVSPNFLVTRLWITVSPGDSPKESQADVRYEYTAVGRDGEAFVRTHTPAMWTEFMQKWERALNEYLRRATEASAATVSQRA